MSTAASQQSALRQLICAEVADSAGLQPEQIECTRSLYWHGLNSAAVTGLMARLAQRLGRPLSPLLAWASGSIEGFIAGLIGDAAANELDSGDRARPVAGDGGTAIVGMSCRFPGARSPEELWSLLVAGGDAISEVPTSRFGVLSQAVPRWGGFISGVEDFDASFFGIAPREAAEMDPQQRLLLELAWEALESAGIVPSSLKGSRTGVFFGMLFHDFALLKHGVGPSAIGPHTSTGSAGCMLANRVSYALGLRGPSLVVDSACSSSLVALHMANESLLRGECDLALVGGVNLMLAAETSIGFARLGAMAADGRCKAFDARADGYVRGEGGGVVVLERTISAVKAGRPLVCLLRGSSVNNNGSGNGLTAPNPEVQAELLRDAVRRANVEPASVAYVEAHGPGTALGDPIEAQALGAVYGKAPGRTRPLLVGSIKTNIGHLEAAAGIAGLIKTALALQHGVVPANLHFQQPNPLIDFSELNLEVVRETRALSDELPRAAVSSFGYGGTNAHAVLEALGEKVSMEAATSSAPIAASARLAWIFSGQGSQWRGMAQRALLTEPVFRAQVARCDRALSPLLGRSIVEFLLSATDAEWEDLRLTWPALFAVQVGLSGLLESWGARPSAVIGHSAGEVAAAHVAGVLDLHEAARVIVAQARCAQAAPRAAMAVLGVGWEQAQSWLEPFASRIERAIAASPQSTVVCGAEEDVDELVRGATAEGIFARRVHTSRAVHVRALSELSDALAKEIGVLHPHVARVPIFVAGSGGAARGSELDTAYWARRLAEPVWFQQCIDAAWQAGNQVFIELAPHAIAARSVEECLAAHDGAVVLTSFDRAVPDERAIERLRNALRPSFGDSAPAQPLVLPFSAQSDAALREQARALAAILSDAPSRGLFESTAYTLGMHRQHLALRGAVHASDATQAARALEAVACGRQHPAAAIASRAAWSAPQVVFVFPGQGSQWLGMGRHLFASQPAFRARLLDCDRAILECSQMSVIAELHAEETQARFDEVDVIQPCLFAMQVALAAQFEAWGIEPAAVVGHSMGEVAAACVAGALSLEDAARVICARSRLVRRAAGRGGMALVELTRDEAEIELSRCGGAVSVAAVNGPRSVLLSGDACELDAVLAALEARGTFCRRVKVDYASHCAQMDALEEPLSHALAGVRPRRARFELLSTVTAESSSGENLDADYWFRNLRRPVEFHAAISALLARPNVVFLELSPHPVLAPAIEQAVAVAKAGQVVTTLRRDTNEVESALSALAKLFVLGADVDFDPLQQRTSRCCALPAYAWQKQHFALPVPTREAHPGEGRHAFLRSLTDAPAAQTTLEGNLALTALGYLNDHKVGGAVVLPAAVFVEAALTAGRRHFGVTPTLLGFEIESALGLTTESTVLQVALEPAEPGRADVTVRSRSRNEPEAWRVHARGTLSARVAPAFSLARRLDESCVERIAQEALYTRLVARGLDYGPYFRRLNAIAHSRQLATADIATTATDADGWLIDPGVLDAAFQLAFVAAADYASEAPGAPSLPVSLRRLQLGDGARPPFRAWAATREIDAEQFECDLVISDASGRSVADVEGLCFRRVSAWSEATQRRSLRSVWRELPLSAAPSEARGAWILLSDDQEFAESALAALERRGGRGRVYSSRQLASAWPDFGAVRGVVTLIERGCEAGAPESPCVLPLMAAQRLARASGRDRPRLWFITRGAQTLSSGEGVDWLAAGVWGLARTVVYEHPELRTSSLDLPTEPATEDFDRLAEELASDPLDQECVLRGGRRWVSRLAHQRETPLIEERRQPADGRSFQLVSDEPGRFDRLRYVTVDRRAPAAGEVEVRVEAAAVNFLDVMKALRMYPGQSAGRAVFGSECSGTVLRVGAGVSEFAVGDRVVAYGEGTLGSHLVTAQHFVARRPRALADDGSLLIAFVTAWYALRHIARIQPGQRVLIHSAAGSTGLAAMQIAQGAGATVWATASSAEKREYLTRLGAERVFESRSLDFARQISELTGGAGIDVVLNSLAGEAMRASLEVVAEDGHFLELGKVDIYQHEPLDLAKLRKRLSVSAIDMVGLARRRPERFAQALREVMAAFEAGELSPTPARHCPAAQAPEVFRNMAEGRHIGRWVLDFADHRALEVDARNCVREDASYVVSGGLGALGLRAASWLVDRGARRLILFGRSGARGSALDAVRDLERRGARVDVVAVDVADAAALAAALEAALAGAPPLRGVLHAAGVLDDAMLESQSPERFANVFRAKVAGARNLHELTRDSQLDFFVLFSSVMAVLGSPGQANYVAANACLDALAHQRRALGLPALSLNFGPFAEAGLAAEAQRADRLARRGLGALALDELDAALSSLLGGAQNQAVCARFDARQWLEFHPVGALATRFAELLEDRSATAVSVQGNSLRADLSRLEPAAAAARVESAVRDHIAEVLRLDANQVEPQAPLKGLGLDSLTGLELRNRLETSFGVSLPATLIWTYPTAAALAGHLCVTLKIATPPRATDADTKASSDDVLDSIVVLSDVEKEALLEQALAALEDN